MKLIHTSDWHLGRMLYGRKRHPEHQAFLHWLLDTLKTEKIDVLVIAGDIFDTGTPGNRAQELYYRFLVDVQQTGCRHVVVVSGNHDSPSFLDAPKAMLNRLRIHVVGQPNETTANDVLVLQDAEGRAEAIVCAVPYLRERDLRIGTSVTDFDERQQEIAAAIQTKYQEALAAAQEKMPSPKVPLIATGHLFAAGGTVTDDDGVRDLYVGNLEGVSASTFPKEFDYVALGHLHSAQVVGGRQTVRYCGAPIPMGFGEAAHAKVVVSVEWRNAEVQITELPIPSFMRLETILGDILEIESRLTALVEAAQPVWVEVDYTGTSLVSDLKERVFALTEKSPVEVLRIQNRLVFNHVLGKVEQTEELADLTPKDVFARCLDIFNIDNDARPALQQLHDHIWREVEEADQQKEQ